MGDWVFKRVSTGVEFWPSNTGEIKNVDVGMDDEFEFLKYFLECNPTSTIFLWTDFAGFESSEVLTWMNSFEEDVHRILAIESKGDGKVNVLEMEIDGQDAKIAGKPCLLTSWHSFMAWCKFRGVREILIDTELSSDDAHFIFDHLRCVVRKHSETTMVAALKKFWVDIKQYPNESCAINEVGTVTGGTIGHTRLVPFTTVDGENYVHYRCNHIDDPLTRNVLVDISFASMKEHPDKVEELLHTFIHNAPKNGVQRVFADIENLQPYTSRSSLSYMVNVLQNVVSTLRYIQRLGVTAETMFFPHPIPLDSIESCLANKCWEFQPDWDAELRKLDEQREQLVTAYRNGKRIPTIRTDMDAIRKQEVGIVHSLMQQWVQILETARNVVLRYKDVWQYVGDMDILVTSFSSKRTCLPKLLMFGSGFDIQELPITEEDTVTMEIPATTRLVVLTTNQANVGDVLRSTFLLAYAGFPITATGVVISLATGIYDTRKDTSETTHACYFAEMQSWKDIVKFWYSGKYNTGILVMANTPENKDKASLATLAMNQGFYYKEI